MKFWKRNAIIATLLVFVCVAVFLNWQYNKADELPAVDADYADVEDSGKLLGETTLVDGDSDVDASADTEIEDMETSDIVDEAEVYEDGEDYFSTARLTRQQSRDAALALLEEAVSVQGITQEVVDETSEAMESMAALTLAESNIENLIIAKGFEDCVAFASDDGISLVVAEPSDGFTVSDIAKITDVVTTEMGYTAEQIKIVGV